MNRPRQFITSVRVDGNAAHDFVTIFIRGQNVGTLCVGKGDGGRLFALLEPGLPRDETSVTADVPPPGKPTDDESPAFREWVSAIDERAAANELVRRGLELDAMNRGRRLSGMPELTATAALTLADASSQLHAILDRPDVVARDVIAGMNLDTLCPNPFEPDATNVERARLFGMTETDLRSATERFVTRARNFEIRHRDWQRAFRVYLHKHYQPAKPPLGTAPFPSGVEVRDATDAEQRQALDAATRCAPEREP